MYSQKGISTIMILLLIGLVAVMVVGGYFVWQYFSGDDESEQVICTQDAKLCPDGSYVSRTGPKCEFAQCPVQKPTEWIDLSRPESGFSMKYPTNFFDSGKEPKIFSIQCGYTTLPTKCPSITAFVANVPSGSQVSSERITINQYNYCKYSLNEGAAGKIYYYDYYATVKNGRCIVIELDTLATNCDNYTAGSEDYQSCIDKNDERANLLQQIVATFQFPK